MQVYSKHREPESQHCPHCLWALVYLASPIAPLFVLQGPRFMTSEYDPKYLKEPSNQPGRQE